jgi:hypothetical protein
VSTFGDPATPTEHDLLDALPCVQQRFLRDDPKQLTTTAFQLGTQLVEDLQIIQASHRWTPALPIRSSSPPAMCSPSAISPPIP